VNVPAIEAEPAVVLEYVKVLIPVAVASALLALNVLGVLPLRFVMNF